jgi:hypothetical protein
MMKPEALLSPGHSPERRAHRRTCEEARRRKPPADTFSQEVRRMRRISVCAFVTTHRDCFACNAMPCGRARRRVGEQSPSLEKGSVARPLIDNCTA